MIRMPDFAGVALVDILANGVAMLIIVVVVSIAARIEREEHYAERADQVAAVMSHKISTSLVLNSLAASPPALLHDYESWPIDLARDPELLPILELHPGFVREFYSATRWSRRNLLREYSGLSAWLGGLRDEQKKRLRVDIYDVAQFYLVMSILREHNIPVLHWHFLAGALSPGDAARCPAGVAAKDCRGVAARAPPVLPELAGTGGDDAAAGADWPLFATDAGSGGRGPGAMPGGVVPGASGTGNGNGDFAAPGSGAGGGSAGSPRDGTRGSGFGSQAGGAGESAAGLGSFPNARSGGAGTRSGGQAQRGPAGQPGGRSQIALRIALPDFIRRAAGAGSGGLPSLDVMFGALLHYLGELQDTLDAGKTPSRHIAHFARQVLQALRQPPPISHAEGQIARNLARRFAFMARAGEGVGEDNARPKLLALQPLAATPGSEHSLALTPNRQIEAVGVSRSGAPAGELPERGRVSLALNAYPGIWQGLDLQLEPGSVLLMPPEPRRPGQMRWRAAAYISPQLDDFVIGFVFGDFDAQGRLRAQADANRLQLDGRSLFSEYRAAVFGARGWLVSLYAALLAGLLLLGLAWRLLSSRST